MGDRTYASLHISGILSCADDARELFENIRNYGGCDDGDEPATAPTEAAELPCYFTFDEINYGEIPAELEGTLYALGLNYSWSHGAGDAYGASGTVEVEGTTYTQNLTENSLPYLEYGEFDNADKRADIEAYVQADAQVRAQPLLYAPTAHALLAAFQNNPEALAAWRAMREARAA